MSTHTTPKVTHKCARCGGTNVLRDAWAEWDDETPDLGAQQRLRPSLLRRLRRRNLP